MRILGYIDGGKMRVYRNPLPTGLTSTWYRKGQSQARSSFHFTGWIDAWDHAGTKPRDSYEREAAKSAFIAGFYAARKGTKTKGSKASRRKGLLRHLSIFGF